MHFHMHIYPGLAIYIVCIRYKSVYENFLYVLFDKGIHSSLFSLSYSHSQCNIVSYAPMHVFNGLRLSKPNTRDTQAMSAYEYVWTYLSTYICRWHTHTHSLTSANICVFLFSNEERGKIRYPVGRWEYVNISSVSYLLKRNRKEKGISLICYKSINSKCRIACLTIINEYRVY